MPQSMSPTAQSYIDFVLRNLHHIVKSSELLVLRQANDDYFSRGWCFHEWFTAQFVASKARTFLDAPMLPARDEFEIVCAKRRADRVLGGCFEELNELGFSVARDRDIVNELTKKAAVRAQRRICETCLEIIHKTIEDAGHRFPTGLAISIDDIHTRFLRLTRFSKVWTLQLQPIEPVTDRIAMFFHSRHWESLIELSRHIATDLLAMEYSRELRDEEATLADRELRRVYEFCQMRVPEARYAVTAFMCFFLMGYDYHDEIPDAQHRTAQQCGLISQEFLNQGRYGEAEAYAQAQLRKAHLEFDDAQTEKALSKLGRIHRNVGNLPEAAKFYQRSLNLSQQMCDKRSEAIALDQIGGLHLKGGDPAEAIKYYNKSLAIHERLGNLLDIGVEFGNIGSAYLHLSEFKKAKETLEKAVEYSTRAEDSRNLLIWYFNLGQVHEQTEHSHDALDSYKKSWILNKLVGDAQLDSILRVKLGLQDR